MVAITCLTQLTPDILGRLRELGIARSTTCPDPARSLLRQHGPKLTNAVQQVGILEGQVGFTPKTAKALGEDAAEAFGQSIPIVGVAVSAGALLYDGYQTYKAHSECLAGVHK